jgi:hypothetical protein
MIDRIKQVSIVEWALIEVVFFTLFWLKNPYVAKLLTITLSPIFLGILLISLAADKFDKSNIDSKYYKVMFVFTIVPILLYFLFHSVLDFQISS